MTNLGVAVSVLEQRRYGYQFGDAVTGHGGEIIFGEDEVAICGSIFRRSYGLDATF